MFGRFIISTSFFAFTLTSQACAQSVDVSEEPNTKTATIEAVVPKSIPMTLEEIRVSTAE